jgi:pilus assembly protein CpaE
MRTIIATSRRLSDPICLKTRKILQENVDPQGPLVVHVDQLEVHLAKVQPEILAIVLAGSPASALGVLRRIRSKYTGRILVVGEATQPKQILTALHEGADHYLDEQQLEQQLQGVLARHSPAEEASAGGRLISILGASGGVGCSTVAVNLAVSLAREHTKCALVDLKPGVNDLAALLDLRAAHTLADLCNNAHRLDQDMVEGALVRHDSGVHLLAFTQNFRDIRLVSSPAVKLTLALIRASFPYVVLDLDDCYHDEQVQAIQFSDVILIVLRPDFTSLRNTRGIVEHLERLGIKRDRVQFVLNRQGQAHEVSQTQVEGLLSAKGIHYLPDEPKTVNAANNAGAPVILRAPASKLAQGICRLARTLDGTASSDSAPTILLTLRKCLTPWQ